MRATRGFVGALGAGLTLVIASSILLLVVSSVVAFNGWPDDLSGASETRVASLVAAGSSARPAAALDLAAAAAPAPRTARRTADRDRAALPGARTQARPEAGVLGRDSSGSATTTPSSSDPAAFAGEGTPARAQSPVEPVADAVRETTKAAGDAIAPVAPAVGGALESVGAAGADAVDRVADTAAGATQNLVP